MKILVLEDDVRMAQFIGKALREAGYVVEHLADGRDGLAAALSGPYDSAVVDVMLPGMNGLDVIRELRGHGITMPVIVLSARSSVDDRVLGLQAGGDDYLVKPFALSELLARVQALIRRSQAVAEPTLLTVGPLSVDLLRRRVRCEGKDVELQPREFALLEYLMRNSGRVVSKSTIMERVWEYNFDPQTNVVEARICRLRDKLDRVAACKLIHTIRGVGYVLEPRP